MPEYREVDPNSIQAEIRSHFRQIYPGNPDALEHLLQVRSILRTYNPANRQAIEEEAILRSHTIFESTLFNWSEAITQAK